MAAEALLSRPERAQLYVATHAQQLAERTAAAYQQYETWLAEGAVPEESVTLLGLGTTVETWAAGSDESLAVRTPRIFTHRTTEKIAELVETPEGKAALQGLEDRLPALVRSEGIAALEQPVAIGGIHLWTTRLRGPAASSVTSSDVSKLDKSFFHDAFDTFVALENRGLGIDSKGANVRLNPAGIGLPDVGIDHDQPREVKAEALLTTMGDCGMCAETEEMRTNLPLWLTEEQCDMPAATERIAKQMAGRIGAFHLFKEVLIEQAYYDVDGVWDASIELAEIAIKTATFKAETPALVRTA